MKSSDDEKQFVNWMKIFYFKKINLADLIIKGKSVDLSNDHNSKNPLNNQVSVSFSNGWILKFKKRNGFKIYRSYGKSGDAGALAIQEILTVIQDTIHKYAMNNLWNAKEFGLLQKMAPITTIGPRRLPGRNVQKYCVTFLACTNVEGSEISHCCS